MAAELRVEVGHLDPCHPDIECRTFDIERNNRYRRLRYRVLAAAAGPEASEDHHRLAYGDAEASSWIMCRTPRPTRCDDDR